MVFLRPIHRHEKTNIDVCDYVGDTALHVACEKNNLAMFKLLIAKKAKVTLNARNLTPLMKAANAHSVDIVS